MEEQKQPMTEEKIRKGEEQGRREEVEKWKKKPHKRISRRKEKRNGFLTS